MKLLVVIALIVLGWLQYSLWFGQSGHFTQVRLQQQIDEQEGRVAVIRHRNQLLEAEVVALQKDNSALEARARQDLGMIKRGEVYYLVPRSD